MNVLASAVPQISVCIFRIKNKQPTIFVLYDTDNVQQCIARIKDRHPDYEYISMELMPGKAEAANFVRSFNKMMLFYDKFLTVYGPTSQTN